MHDPETRIKHLSTDDYIARLDKHVNDGVLNLPEPPQPYMAPLRFLAPVIGPHAVTAFLTLSTMKLNREKISVHEIGAECGLAPATVSKALQTLEGAGLIDVEKINHWRRRYRLSDLGDPAVLRRVATRAKQWQQQQSQQASVAMARA